MKLKYLLLSASFFAGCDASLTLHDAGGSCGSDSDCKAPLVCSNNTCAVSAVGGSSTGGSDGTTDSGAASTGGTSTGSSDGTIITTSSGGSSGGSTGSSTGPIIGASSTGGSSGGSTGSSSSSSTGGPPPKSHVNLINAAPNSTGNLDICVRGIDDPAPILGLTGSGAAYKGVSTFFDVTPSASSSIWVVDAGGDCSTPLGAAGVQSGIDLSDSTLLYTVVVYQDNSDDASAGITFTVVPGQAPVTAGNVNFEIVHALVTADQKPASFATELPHNEAGALTIGTVSPGDPNAGEIGPLSDAVLSVTTAGSLATFAAPYEFPGINVPANEVVTLVVVGNEDAAATVPTQLLLCDESADVPSCSVVAVSPTGFVRLANLTDPLDTISATF